MTPGFWLDNLDGWCCHFETENSGERERFREKIRFRGVSFGLGLRCWWKTKEGIFIKLLGLDSTQESRVNNINLDQSVYRWALVARKYWIWWANCVDEKTTVDWLPKYREKDKEPMKKNGKKWQEKKAENKWSGMFQYPREEKIPKRVMSNVQKDRNV